MCATEWPPIPHSYLTEREREDIMPRASKSPSINDRPKQRTQPRKADTKDEWAGFVPCELGVDHKDAFDEWLGEAGSLVWADVVDALGTGMKLSVTYDAPNQCFIASFSGRPDIVGEHEFNAVLSARAGTIDDAIALLVYKHVAVLQGDWWAALNTPKANKRAWG